MSLGGFDNPVTVFVGLGMPRGIGSAFQAYAFLSETALDRRKPAFISAQAACLAVINRQGDEAVARQAFRDYALEAGILVSEDEITVPAISSPAIRLAS
jgi:hypothetical protein